MLRSWTERLRIYLHPEQVVLVRTGGWVKRRLLAKQVIPVTDTGATPWSGALTVLEHALQQPEWQAAAQARVTLAGPLVRYRLAPWDARLSEEERMALLRHQFGEVHGEAIRSWNVILADGGFGKPGLACAVDGALMQALQATFSQSKARLTSVQPCLMTAISQWRQQIDATGAWLLLAEKSHLTIAFFQSGQWQGIRTHAIQPGWEETLDLLLAREALHLGVETAGYPLYFSWPERPGFVPALTEIFRVQMLHLPAMDGYSPQTDRDIAVALCG